jgi:uncharacterized protein
MNKTRVPFRQGLFTEEDGNCYLSASKCKSCGQTYFPPRARCPQCFSQDMEQTKLSRTGKVYSYTVVRMPVHKYKPPLALAWIEFPEGLRVFGQLKGWENVTLKIGLPVRVVADTLWEAEDKEVYGYKFEIGS